MVKEGSLPTCFPLPYTILYYTILFYTVLYYTVQPSFASSTFRWTRILVFFWNMLKTSTGLVISATPPSNPKPFVFYIINPLFLPLMLPLPHESGALCLYEPLPVSDALGDDFFAIFDVFLVETFFFSFLSSLPCMGQRLQKNSRPPKGHISGENNSMKKKI